MAGGADLSPAVGEIRGSVVGQHLLDHDVPVSIPVDRAAEEGRRVLRPFGRQYLGIEDLAVVVDSDVQILPSRVRAADDAVPTDPFPDLPEAAELLDVHVQQLARAFVLVAA